MPSDGLDSEAVEKALEATTLPSSPEGLHLLPVSQDEFHAQWRLEASELERGRLAASRHPHESHLVLRAFNLSNSDAHETHSNSWTDFSIAGIDGEGYFNLAGSIPKIGASLGLINRSGRFTPLASADAVHLPVAPQTEQRAENPPLDEVDPDTSKTDVEPTTPQRVVERPEAGEPLLDPELKAGRTTEELPEPSLSQTELSEKSSNVPEFKLGQSELENANSLPEAEILERLSRIHGLPEGFVDIPEALGPASLDELVQSGDQAKPLDEADVLERVRKLMAIEPEPEIIESGSAQGPSKEPAPGSATSGPTDENIAQGPTTTSHASQWEVLWSDHSPVTIEAVFILSGRIAPEFRLLLGQEIIQPRADGGFTWKQKLSNFHQAWSLIEAALTSPSVAAGPALEFFKGSERRKRLLDLQASLEISGQVSDLSYIAKMPKALNVTTDGRFKVSRFLPNGAVILPGLSLIAE